MPRKKTRTFAVFFDYKNIADGLAKNGHRLRDVNSLLKIILDQGEIIFAFVFVPEHLVNQAPLMQLTYEYRFTVVLCPRQIEGIITKDKDTVDSTMDFLGHRFVEHSQVTDIAIFSGDHAFVELANHAYWRKKRVMVISAQNSISGRFLQMAQDEKIEVVTV